MITHDDQHIRVYNALLTAEVRDHTTTIIYVMCVCVCMCVVVCIVILYVLSDSHAIAMH